MHIALSYYDYYYDYYDYYYDYYLFDALFAEIESSCLLCVFYVGFNCIAHNDNCSKLCLESQHHFYKFHMLYVEDIRKKHTGDNMGLPNKPQ